MYRDYKDFQLRNYECKRINLREKDRRMILFSLLISKIHFEKSVKKKKSDAIPSALNHAFGLNKICVFVCEI